jgi:hypothetical protein
LQALCEGLLQQLLSHKLPWAIDGNLDDQLGRELQARKATLPSLAVVGYEWPDPDTRLSCDPLPYKNVLKYRTGKKIWEKSRFSFQYVMYQEFSQTFLRAVLLESGYGSQTPDPRPVRASFEVDYLSLHTSSFD